VRNKIINKEEKNVRNARFFVIAAGIACAVAVGFAINTFASDSEQTRFEVEVRNFE
jgi:high-affinity Fe2+/Pb2+ permease